jgi:predicted nucleic acid-binding protein
MYALDTNVVSEITRVAPDPNVMTWLNAAPRASVFLPSIVVAELCAGVELMEPGKRRRVLDAMIRDFVASVGPSNIIDFGLAEAAHYARIVALRQRQGRRIMVADAQVAACAASRGMPVVTRNVPHFSDCGIEIVNPWNPQP